MQQKTISKSIRTNIIIGLLLITPLVVTLIIINFLFTLITSSIVPEAWLQTNLGLIYRFAALIIIIVGLYAIGLLARNFIGKSLYRLGDRIMTRIPVIKSVYVAVRNVSESLISSKNIMFKQVVAIQFPRQGVYSIGFLTACLTPEMALNVFGMPEGDEYVNVFIPNAPNPTTGFVLIVPRREIQPLNISVVDAMKLVVSVGAELPGRGASTPQSLLDHLDEWMNPNRPTIDSSANSPTEGTPPAPP